MDSYKLYCELYKQHYIKPHLDKEDIDDDDFEIPAKLNKAKFEELKMEYLHLDRKTMFGDLDDADYDRYFALKDLLFGDVVIG
jgi:hypothetical protein